MLEITPSENSIPFNCGAFDTLCDALDYAAKGHTGLNFYSARGDLETTLSYRELRERAMNMAARMSAVTQRGDRIGLMAETSPDFAVMFYACQYAGLLPVPISVPTRLGGHELYSDQVSQVSRTARLHSLLVPTSIRGVIAEALRGSQITIGDLSGTDMPEAVAPVRPLQADEMCYIQFSSGSTSAPKGILGSQKSVTANCRAIQSGLEARAGDRISSWLPLYHDMGLIGQFIAPMMSQLSVDYMSPQSFARRPATWLKLISENRATHSYSPSFGYELCAKRWRGGELDLSSWRVAGIGGDMIRRDALELFKETFASHGFSPSAFVPSYGLAEATVAVSFSRLHGEVLVDVINAERMRETQFAMPACDLTRDADRRSLISCGRAIEGHEMMVCDDEGNRLEDREVGRVLFRGDSVSPGIVDPDNGVMPLTDEDGWLDTGDLGYWLDGEVVITGRHKDLILWNGRNIWPQDIEWAAEKAGGRKISKSVAFEVRDEGGPDGIYLLAECKTSDLEERSRLVSDVTASVRQLVGAPVFVLLVPNHSLVMTSSGKLSRMRTRRKFLSGTFDRVEQPDRNVAVFAQ